MVKRLSNYSPKLITACIEARAKSAIVRDKEHRFPALRQHMPSRGSIMRSAGLRLLVIVIFLAAAGFLCATLVRFAPGFGVDERELDSRLSDRSIVAIRGAHQDEQNVFRFYAKYLAG